MHCNDCPSFVGEMERRLNLVAKTLRIHIENNTDKINIDLILLENCYTLCIFLGVECELHKIIIIDITIFIYIFSLYYFINLLLHYIILLCT